MVMNAKFQADATMLQMSRAELLEQMQAELKENPLLEDAGDSDTEHLRDEPTDHEESVGETEQPVAQPLAKEQSEAGKELPVDGQPTSEVDWTTFLENSATVPSLPAMERPDGDEMPTAGQMMRSSRSLEDHLMEQLRMARLSKEEEVIAQYIIGSLNPDGYFTDPPLAEVAEECEVSLEIAERALKRLQRFDPWGCGARNLQECLLVQAEMQGIDDEMLVKILTEHLSDLEKKNWDKIAKKLKVDVEDVYEAAKDIQSLDPRPGREFSTEQPQYITPDVYIHKVGDKYFVAVNDDGMPKLRISRYYLETMKDKDKDNKAAREYVQERLRSAKWLIDSIQQRQRTIIKVTESILKFQRDFFEKGAGCLKPLILRDVANDIGMHESTISRATANKYVHTPQGLFELKYFFNIGINREGGQDDIASESVKGFIKTLVGAENSKNPYSDQKIVELLRQKHQIEIARRTVAKYREQLGILPSGQRKQSDCELQSFETTIERRSCLSFVVTLEGTVALSDDFSKRVRAILATSAKDQNLRIKNIRAGSIIIEVEGSEEGYNRILEAIQSTVFQEILGHRIQSIKIVRDTNGAGHTAQPQQVSQSVANQGDSIFSCAQLRKIISGILVTDSMLDAFALDHFGPVKKQFTNGMERLQKETLLLELADYREIVATLKREYPYEWSRVARRELHSD